MKTTKNTEIKEVRNYNLFASNGRYIRRATLVEFSNGRCVRFTEMLSKREAIRQATSEPAGEVVGYVLPLQVLLENAQ